MSEEHHGAPCGLCGNFNHIAGDDLTTARDILTDEPALFANSWAVDLPRERACSSVDLDFSGPCQSESDMDVRIAVAVDISDDEKTFCRALVEYTRACSHVGYPVREWRDSFPSCGKITLELLILVKMMAAMRVLYTETALVAVRPPVHLRQSALEPTSTVWMAATVQMVSFFTMERASLWPSARVYTMEHHIHKDMCFNKDAVFVECSVIGDVFVTTFDGRIFLHPGVCQYVLAKSRGGSKFTVTMQYTTCSEQQVCIQSVSVVLDEDVSHQITLTREGDVIIGVNAAASLPYVDDAVEVRRLTSVFTQLKAGIGLKLQYDGRGGRVYLQLDSRWRGQTLGLCGTFNGNLRDDFLSPAGMIEGTPQLHANAWKISSACVAPVNQPIIDPCELNQNNVFYASQCEVLMGSVFSPCHGYISPNIYQQQCRYQACHCGSSCLCTALAHYAYLCSKHGVRIDFRSQVSECGVVCLGGMLYHSCVSSCGRSCRALSGTETCNLDDCAEGCGCPDGSYYDDVRQRCVQLSQCHCYSIGGVSQPGEVTFSASGPCLCRNGKMECVPEEKEPDSGEVGECPEGKVYHSCAEQGGGVACAPTCRNLMLNLTCPPSTPCISGCVCPPGLVLHQGRCYYPENCPCGWLGLEYLPGETVETPCYKCVCHRGYFNCTYFPCPAVCTIYSDRHYHTFDGLEYDYHTDCQVYLLKSVGETEVSIVAQNKDCYESGIVCIKFLVIHVGLTKIYFTDNSGNPSPSTVVGRGSEFELWKAGYYTVVHFPNQEMTILWDHKTTVHITAGPRWKGLLTGLCGNFDSVTVNDMTTSSHMEVNNAQTFGDSWALGQCESDYVVERPCEGDLGRQPYAKRECALLYSDVFAPCHNVVDVAWFYRNCLTDTCNCNRGGDCECLCTSIAAYAHKCCQQGITIQWRSPSICPYDCEYYNQELGSGPFSLVSAVSNDTIFGVNRTSNAVIPLAQVRPGQLPPPGILFNFMITMGLQKDRASQSSFVIPHRLMCEWRYQACASPCAHTCSDPDATRCQFLPPVEGCFPRCPKNMVLDEVTRRCVYTEDCENLLCVPSPNSDALFIRDAVEQNDRSTNNNSCLHTIATFNHIHSYYHSHYDHSTHQRNNCVHHNPEVHHRHCFYPKSSYRARHHFTHISSLLDCSSDNRCFYHCHSIDAARDNRKREDVDVFSIHGGCYGNFCFPDLIPSFLDYSCLHNFTVPFYHSHCSDRVHLTPNNIHSNCSDLPLPAATTKYS
ncbi:Otogelin-like protein [Takifugu flavidus]|uniref:Otogelin-like protein n=1 Tax=Takifugu flavidus TaxID=433684 RepID=A0A5C6PAC7_9TELE|nr:Otogelin-like protein [Takifugu flavidus]